MHQVRVNVALLLVVLAPLVFAISVNLVTGGTFANALEGSNIWALPLLLISAAVMLTFNMKEALKQRSAKSIEKPKPFEGFTAKRPQPDDIFNAPALPPPSQTGRESPTAKTPRRDSWNVTEVDSLVRALWPRTKDYEARASAYRAAWRLSSMMSSKIIQVQIKNATLPPGHLGQPRLSWLRYPDADPGQAEDPLNIVVGRVGYLIREGGIEFAPTPPLEIDPYIGVALLVVREQRDAYHDACSIVLHDGDLYRLDRLRSSFERLNGPADEDSADPEKRAFAKRSSRWSYSDIGRVLQPELLHTDKKLGEEQAYLVRHVIRHFITDNFAGLIFDALPDEIQVRLAVRMLTARQWMSPSDWEYWATTGRNPIFALKLEAVSDLAYVVGGGVVLGVVGLGFWQLAVWLSRVWSWYFGSSHFLGSWSGWSKALLILVAAVVAGAWLSRSPGVGMTLLGVGAVLLVTALLFSPIAKMHYWIPSWVAAATCVIGSLILAALLLWLGLFYGNRRWMQKPIQLGFLSGRELLSLSARSRFRPEHSAGHRDWCRFSESAL